MHGYVLTKKRNDKYSLNVNMNNLDRIGADRIDEMKAIELEPWEDDPLGVETL